MNQSPIRRHRRRGVTLLELLVALVIISILATVATGVYTKEILRARYAKTRAEIAVMEIALNRYYIDLGSFPPSGSGNNTSSLAVGNGNMHVALRSGFGNLGPTPRWAGPYIEWDYNRLGDINGNPVTGSAFPRNRMNFLDPWGTPYLYIASSEYETYGGTELPSSDPFASLETWYNPSTFQLISNGANGTTNSAPNRGLEADDVSNFRGSMF